MTTPRSGWTWSFLPRPPFRTEDAFALWGFAIIRGEMKAHWRVWAGAEDECNTGFFANPGHVDNPVHR